MEPLVALDPAVSGWDSHGRFGVRREGADEGFGEGDEAFDQERGRVGRGSVGCGYSTAREIDRSERADHKRLLESSATFSRPPDSL